MILNRPRFEAKNNIASGIGFAAEIVLGTLENPFCSQHRLLNHVNSIAHNRFGLETTLSPTVKDHIKGIDELGKVIRKAEGRGQLSSLNSPVMIQCLAVLSMVTESYARNSEEGILISAALKRLEPQLKKLSEQIAVDYTHAIEFSFLAPAMKDSISSLVECHQDQGKKFDFNNVLPGWQDPLNESFKRVSDKFIAHDSEGASSNSYLVKHSWDKLRSNPEISGFQKISLYVFMKAVADGHKFTFNGIRELSGLLKDIPRSILSECFGEFLIKNAVERCKAYSLENEKEFSTAMKQHPKWIRD